MKIQLLLTGNELMAGDIVDSNSSLIADFLAEYGWRIHRKVTVGDDPDLLAQEIGQICQQSDVLIINGGLGPTVDDLTAEVLASVAGEPCREHPDALAHLENWCRERNIPLSPANHKQALLPARAEIIPNTRGSAVGIRMVLNNCLILSTPGVPSELRDMLSRSIIPILKEHFEADYVQTRRLATFGLGESGLQDRLSETFPDWPASIELGFRASMPVLEVKLTSRLQQDQQELDGWTDKITRFLGEHFLGFAPISLAQSAVYALQKKGKTVACAESCTGGLIASQLTSVAGSSEVFHAGIVSYSNAMKQELLGVSAKSLQQFGAVSKEVVREMLMGVIGRSGADIGIAVTGIAGPGGGSEDKPVGTVWIAWGTSEQHECRCLHVPMGREFFQKWVSAACLDLIRRLALGLDTAPAYLDRRRKL